MNNFVYLHKSFRRFPKAGDLNGIVAVDLNFKKLSIVQNGSEFMKMASSGGCEGVGVKGGFTQVANERSLHILGKGVYTVIQ